jgi:hypothetical protein
VDDAPPVGERPVYVAVEGIPIVGYVPGRPDWRPTRLAKVVPKTSFSVPPDAEYRRVADDLRAPEIRKDDLVLIVPDDLVRAGMLAIIQSRDDYLELYDIDHNLEPGKFSDQQQSAVEGWRQVGYIVELRRVLSGGLLVSFECETGLTRSMLVLS